MFFLCDRYLDVGRDIVASLQYGARCPCGYCHIEDVETHKQDDHMESFFLAETVRLMMSGCLWCQQYVALLQSLIMSLLVLFCPCIFWVYACGIFALKSIN